MKDQIRINANLQKQGLRQKIEPVIFPCNPFGIEAITSPWIEEGVIDTIIVDEEEILE